MDAEIKRIVDRNDKLKAAKQPWLTTWQLIGEFVRTRKQDFTATITPGQFLTGKIFDSTAPMASHLMASSMLGALWPNNGKTFVIGPPSIMSKEDAASPLVKEFYDHVTNLVQEAIDNPTAAFATSMEEVMHDVGTFGTSGLYVVDNEDDEHMPVSFRSIDVKYSSIDEGPDGFVDTVYTEKQMTIRELVTTYKLENVSRPSQDAYNKEQLDNKVTVLRAIEPRTENVFPGAANMHMPIASVHIEKSADNHVLLRSGFPEMTIFFARFWKTMDEIYGRSPAYEAMPDILEINSMRESGIQATEKMLDPPLAVFNDGSLGPGTLDTSAGAVSVFNVSGRMGNGVQRPFEQLVTVGDIKPTYERITELTEIIKNHFFIDRLLDLNNETRMTLGEAQIRNELRGQSLGTIYARLILELFNRVVIRVFNIMNGRGMFGLAADSIDYQMAVIQGEKPFVIPQVVVDLMLRGKQAYKVTFISPAARIMRASELTGIQQSLTFATEVAKVAGPEILDIYDTDVLGRTVNELTGAPNVILRSADDVQKVREQRAQMQAQQAQIIAAQTQAQTAEHLGKGAQAASKAGLSLDSLLGNGAA